MKKYTDKNLDNFGEICDAVIAEGDRQISLHGIQTRTLSEWMLFLTEEVGELSSAIQDVEYWNKDTEEIKKEAIQVATLALKIANFFMGRGEEQ